MVTLEVVMYNDGPLVNAWAGAIKVGDFDFFEFTPRLQPGQRQKFTFEVEKGSEVSIGMVRPDTGADYGTQKITVTMDTSKRVTISQGLTIGKFISEENI